MPGSRSWAIRSSTRTVRPFSRPTALPSTCAPTPQVPRHHVYGRTRAVRQTSSAPTGPGRQRPHRLAVGRHRGSLGRVRLLPVAGSAAPARLRHPDLTRRAVHPRERRAGVRLLQREQEQQRGHRVASTQEARRTRLPRPLCRDPARAHGRLVGGHPDHDLLRDAGDEPALSRVDPARRESSASPRVG